MIDVILVSLLLLLFLFNVYEDKFFMVIGVIIFCLVWLIVMVGMCLWMWGKMIK